MTRTADALDRLRAADPVTCDGVPAVDGAAVLAAVLATARTPQETEETLAPRRLRAAGRPRTRYVLSALVVATAAAVAVALLPGGVVRPADARAVDALLTAGRSAAAGGDPPLRPGQRIYSKTRSAYLGSSQLPDGSFSSWITPRLSEAWIAADGATVYRTVVAGATTYPTERDRRLADPDVVRPRQGPAIDRIPPQPGTINAPTYDFARTLPTDPAELEARIRRDTEGAGESADVQVWVTVGDLLLSPVAPPALRTALFQVAANVPNVEYLGETKDRLGRRGIAVALSHGDDAHASERDTMIFDLATGRLLERETRSPDAPDVPESMRGVVTGSKVWEQTAVVNAEGLRPDGTRVALR